MELKIKTSVIEAAARKRGFSPVDYVARLSSISRGRRVCAHLIRYESNGEIAVFNVA